MRLVIEGGRFGTAPAVLVAALHLILGGCSAPSDDGPAPGHGDDAGAAHPCLPGEARGADGGCIAAGVPPGLCADGFAPEQDGGCRPVLPSAPCPEGQLAQLGETSCHEIAPCEEGTWGGIPVEPDSQFVDGSYGGGDSDGSQARPWVTIQQAITAAVSGGLVAVAAGHYPEALDIVGKPVRLWGRCPALVELVGPAAAEPAAAAFIRGGADGTELHQLAITGPVMGLLQVGSSEVLISDVWVHHTENVGVVVEQELGPTSLTLRRTLIEAARVAGIHVGGAPCHIEQTVVRNTRGSAAESRWGRGINVQPDDDFRGLVAIEASVFHDNHDVGIMAGGSEITIDATAVLDTLPDQSNQHGGRGISVQLHPDTNDRASAILRRSVVERSSGHGVYLSGSDAQVEGLSVRDTAPQPSDGWFGHGVTAQSSPDETEPTRMSLRSSVVHQSHQVGVGVLGSEAVVASTIIAGTRSRPFDGWYGRGIGLQSGPTGLAAKIELRDSVVEHHREGGLIAVDAEVVVLSSLLRAIEPRVEDGLLGDGITVVSDRSNATAEIVGSRVESVARAGIATFGAQVTLQSTRLECNTIHLNGELFEGRAYSVADLGENACGCESQGVECLVLSAGLEPPPAIGGP